MEMPAFDQIIPSRVILLLVPGVITAIAIIKAAMAVTIEVPVAVTIVCIIPREAVLVTDVAEATPDGDLTHGTLLTPDHLGNTTTSHDFHLDLTEGVDPIHTVEAGPDHLGEYKITNVPDVLQISQEEVTVNDQISLLQSSVIEAIP